MEPEIFDHSEEKYLGIKNNRKIYTGFFPASRGNEKIYYKRSFPESELPKHFVHLIIIHDAGDYHGRYQFLADYMFRKMNDEIVVTWLDLKGHGLSSGTRGHLDDFDEYCEDLGTLMDKIPHPDSKISNILVGNGMGALLALRYFQEYAHKIKTELSGLIISNPLIKLQIDIPKWGGFLMKGWQKTFTHVRFPYRFNGYDLCKDSVMAKAYNSDPMINHQVSMGIIREIFNVSREIRTASYFLNIPTLFQVGEQNHLIDQNTVKLFYKGAPRSLSCFHSYERSGHDLYNDLDRDKAFLDIYNWLREHFYKNEK
ncbi:MAG: alpha/beta fold hydrolase [Bacteriovoracaceae bacterium]|nr:alpha/beta fold hydrolase [Bacteriovoracaceae bacterium]